MSRPISDAWFHRVKSATRDLVKACGGIVRAGEIAHASKSEVSRWQGVLDGDMIPLPAVLALEADCGVAYVTRVMADLNGQSLSGDAVRVGFPEIAARNADVMRAVASFAAEGSEAFADLQLTPSEAERLERALGEIGQATEPLRQALASIRSGGAAMSGPLRMRAV